MEIQDPSELVLPVPRDETAGKWMRRVGTRSVDVVGGPCVCPDFPSQGRAEASMTDHLDHRAMGTFPRKGPAKCPTPNFTRHKLQKKQWTPPTSGQKRCPSAVLESCLETALIVPGAFYCTPGAEVALREQRTGVKKKPVSADTSGRSWDRSSWCNAFPETRVGAQRGDTSQGKGSL